MDQQVDATTTRKPPRRTTKKDKDETPRMRFLRLAPPRMEVALKKISLIGNLAGSGYQYDPIEAKEMIDALTAGVQEVANKFNKTKGGGKGFAFRSGRTR